MTRIVVASGPKYRAVTVDGRTKVQASPVARGPRGIPGPPGPAGPANPALVPIQTALGRTHFEPARICYMGASTMEGAVSTFGAPAGSKTYLTRHMKLVQDDLRTLYPSGVEGSAGCIPAVYANGFIAGDVTKSAGVAAVFNKGGLGQKQLAIGDGESATWPALVFDRVRVWFSKGDFFNGSVDVRIDGTIVGSVSSQYTPSGPTGTTSGFYADFTTTADAAKVVSITRTGASFSGLIDFVEFFNGDGHADGPLAGKGVQVFDGAHSGWRASAFLGAALDQGHWQALSVIKPHLYVMGFGFSDWLNGDSAAFFESNLRQVIDKALDNGADEGVGVLLIKYYRPTSNDVTDTSAEWDDYLAAMDAIDADYAQVTTLDLQSRWPELADDGSTSGDLMWEATHPLHPSYQGSIQIARAVADAITQGASRALDAIGTGGGGGGITFTDLNNGYTDADGGTLADLLNGYSTLT